MVATTLKELTLNWFTFFGKDLQCVMNMLARQSLLHYSKYLMKGCGLEDGK